MVYRCQNRVALYNLSCWVRGHYSLIAVAVVEVGRALVSGRGCWLGRLPRLCQGLGALPQAPGHLQSRCQELAERSAYLKEKGFYK